MRAMQKNHQVISKYRKNPKAYKHQYNQVLQDFQQVLKRDLAKLPKNNSIKGG